MNGTASTAQWLACTGIGTGVSVPVLVLLKLALDAESIPRNRPPRPLPAVPPALPARAPQPLRWHAAPPVLLETQPLRARTYRPRHAKKAA
ncbi:hypothetical protein [Streptomyces sp. NPDC007110]|uniref:hypothetical protein n=1 Tax=Streptomyces sp. NPDC007110 TaxID=3156916 RepID=UPI0033E780FF